MIVDTGPLVAALNAADEHHGACKTVLRALRVPLVTAWPVVTEAMHLLREKSGAQDGLWEFLAQGVVELAPLDAQDTPRLRELMAKYRDLPMDLADASLVRVAERTRQRTIFTLDRRHFSLYRPAGLGRFEIVP